ncbi:MAG: ParB/RepB/Spo0J family partition protein [Leptospiraceae bacterium]|nr:ParB/RepB/Spo0J family partition protein [Leptospiraceae bacterium]
MSLKSKRLGSLADIFQSELLDGTIRKIKIAKISPSEIQPRSDRLKGVEELADSLRTDGLLQPIVVRKNENDDSFKIIAGERRYHAARILGWEEIECKILSKNDKDTYRIAVIENLQRENLSPFDEIEAFKILKNQFDYSDSELAGLIGKSRNYMNEILSVSNLSPEQLQECKSSGMDTKNILIQAAQASKKGDFEEFINRYKSGSLKTVKDAKEFNQTKVEKKDQELIQEMPKPNPKTTIKRVGKSLIVESNNKILLDKIETFAKELASEE